MSRIIICPMCGAQVEADKRFCPVCGATLGTPSSIIHQHSAADNTPKMEAASTLFSRLQNKKEIVAPNPRSASQSVPPANHPVTPTHVTERPRSFKTKPLGVARSQPAPSRAKRTILSPDIKAQLIEFLRGLNKLDRSLEASAVVKRDGSLLASAHSSRVKPEMMATISSTLFGIAADSIRAISGGMMRIVTITAQQVVLMLRPINEDTILLLVTGANSNIGLISMKSELVAQNIANFLAKLT
ncbi:MAG: zinc-ribbon domain-containing protein [Candidatus Helarchaeota archaeon]